MNNLNDIIQGIAQIQLTALRKLRKHPETVDYKNLMAMLEDSETYILSALDKRIKYWEKVYTLPHTFKQIDHYQLGIAAHILFTMVDEWLRENAEGVVECWDLIDNLYQNFHPETQLIWKLNNSSAT